MFIETRKVDKNNPRTIHTPLLRTQLHGTGCSIEGCNCSPGYWINVSDGETSFTIYLDKVEAEEILSSKGLCEYHDPAHSI